MSVNATLLRLQQVVIIKVEVNVKNEKKVEEVNMESEKKVVKVNMEVEKEVIWKAKRKKKRMENVCSGKQTLIKNII